MKCPSCNETLAMTERQGIEIDYCPRCRGVWLDKGELDKIIEKSLDQSSANQSPPSQTNNPLTGYKDHHQRHKGHGGLQQA